MVNTTSLVAQLVYNLPAMQETWVWTLGQEDPLEKRMAAHCNILAWRMPWIEEPGGIQFMRCERVRPDWATDTFSHILWLWNTKWSRAKANRVCQENILVIANILFQQHKRQLYKWMAPDGQYWNQIDHIFCSQRWRSSIQSAETRPGADCGSDHELLIVKFRLKLKKVGKTNRLFKYDLNQIPYDYIVEVRNRFKGLYLADSMPEELSTEVHNIVQESVTKTIPKKKKYKKAKQLSEEAYS